RRPFLVVFVLGFYQVSGHKYFFFVKLRADQIGLERGGKGNCLAGYLQRSKYRTQQTYSYQDPNAQYGLRQDSQINQHHESNASQWPYQSEDLWEQRELLTRAQPVNPFVVVFLLLFQRQTCRFHSLKKHKFGRQFLHCVGGLFGLLSAKARLHQARQSLFATFRNSMIQQLKKGMITKQIQIVAERMRLIRKLRARIKAREGAALTFAFPIFHLLQSKIDGFLIFLEIVPAHGPDEEKASRYRGKNPNRMLGYAEYEKCSYPKE